jgi:hypothetical protein
MPKTLATASSFTPALLAEDLADREGLTGKARQRFLEFLANFDRPVRPGSWRILLSVSATASVLGLFLVPWPGSGQAFPPFLFFWLGSAVLGMILSFGLRRAEQAPIQHDPELNWRVYCLVLRPILLTENPGLLDRNLPTDRSAHETAVVRPVEVCRSIYLDRGADFWWSSILGLWLGMFVLLLGHLKLGWSPTWLWILPLTGLALGPILWSIIQWTAWHVARRRPWLRRW